MSRIPPVYCAVCKGKRLYRTVFQARDGLGRILRESQAQRREDDYTLTVYRCPAAPGFHIGHNPRTRREIEKRLK